MFSKICLGKRTGEVTTRRKKGGTRAGERNPRGPKPGVAADTMAAKSEALKELLLGKKTSWKRIGENRGRKAGEVGKIFGILPFRKTEFVPLWITQTSFVR